jgi:uncharacterized membrane protein required for colicin V production
MSWVDLVIVALVVLAGLRGRAQGALRQVAGFVGLGVGFILGTLVAPSLSSDLTHATWRPILALVIVLVGSLLGSQVGQLVGSVAARSLRALKLGLADSIAGVAVGSVGALVGCWLVAGVLGSITWGSVASGIQQSGILAAMDKVMPPVPSIEARVQTLFRNADFPTIFATVVAPTLPSNVNPKNLGPLVTSLGGPSSVVKVLASGSCNTDSEGTAFYISSHEVVTNAHVVAGHSQITVGGASAQVALFDPANDLAVLRVPSQSETPLRFLAAAPASGTPVEVIGFPLNATRTGAPGFYVGEISGQGRDIYSQTLLTKTVLDVEVNVQPGNSGSPVLDGPFVAGVIESKSLSQSSTAYAIPVSVAQHDIARTPATGTVSTQGCLP